MRSRRHLPPVLLFLAACASGTVIEVRAGKYDRRETPLVARVRVPWDSPKVLWRLVRAADGRELPVQTDRAPIYDTSWHSIEVCWILEEPLSAGATRRYRVESCAVAAAPKVACQTEQDRSYTFRVDGRDILRYNASSVPAPEGVDPVFARGGYIHPVWTPSGRVVTNDFPKNHLHHHGIWSAWTRTVFEGREVDFWNLGAKKGRVEEVTARLLEAGPTHGGLGAHHRSLDVTAPDGPKPVIEESWSIRVYAAPAIHVFDIRVHQGCIGANPLELKRYHYGGLGFRGPASWEDKKDCAFLTSEGKTRADGNGTKARWCIVSGPVDGAPAYVAILCHPSSFRAPQPVRLSPKDPFFCYAPPAEGDFEIARDKPYRASYRFVAGDGPPDPAEIERFWRDFAEPPEVVVR